MRGREGDCGEHRPEAHGSLDNAQLERIGHHVALTRIDARGCWCPEPIVRLQEVSRKLADGDIVMLRADDPGIELDVPAWCISTGNEYLGLLRDPGELRAFVRLRAAGGRPGDQPKR